MPPAERKHASYAGVPAAGTRSSLLSPQVSGRGPEVAEARGCEKSSDGASGAPPEIQTTAYRPNAMSTARLQWHCGGAGFVAAPEAERPRAPAAGMPPSPSQVPAWRNIPAHSASHQPLPVRRPHQEAAAAPDHAAARGAQPAHAGADPGGHRDENPVMLGSPQPEARPHLYLPMTMRSPLSPQPSWSPLSPKSSRVPLSPPALPIPDRWLQAPRPMPAVTLPEPTACRPSVERQAAAPSSVGGVPLGKPTAVPQRESPPMLPMGRVVVPSTCVMSARNGTSRESQACSSVPSFIPVAQVSKEGTAAVHPTVGAAVQGAASLREPTPSRAYASRAGACPRGGPAEGAAKVPVRAEPTRPDAAPGREGREAAAHFVRPDFVLSKEANLSVSSFRPWPVVSDGAPRPVQQADQAAAPVAAGPGRDAAALREVPQAPFSVANVSPMTENNKVLSSVANGRPMTENNQKCFTQYVRMMPAGIVTKDEAPSFVPSFCPAKENNGENHHPQLARKDFASFDALVKKEEAPVTAQEELKQSQSPPVTTSTSVPLHGQRAQHVQQVRVAKFKCGACGALLDSKEEAAYHCASPATDVFKYRCPGCGALLDTREEALRHCAADTDTASTGSSDSDDPETCSTATPTAAADAANTTPTLAAPASAPSIPAAFATPAAASPTSTPAAAASAPAPCAAPAAATTPSIAASPSAASIGAAASAAAPEAAPPDAPAMPAGEPVAFDDRGQPIIVRQLDDETGKVRTVVRNEDGLIRAFGEVTVSSLASSGEQDAKRWVDGLSDRELRALVHEVGHRLLWNSRQYETHQAELEKMVDTSNYIYFGLPVGAPEKALDNAYRKLAKRMHPDKNGGTEEAKQDFQQMKERYEALKKSRNPEERREQKNEEEMAEEGRGPEDPDAEGEACDEDDAAVDRPAPGEEEGTIEYDPSDRQSLHKTVWRMLTQLKTMQKGLQDLVTQLGRASAQATGTTTVAARPAGA